MKSKKGFTLVELLAVIVILITITLMAVPTVLRLIKKNREIAYETKLDTILRQAKQYARDNEDFLYASNKKYIQYVCNSITVKQLLDAGYLKELSSNGGNSIHIKNPKTGENMDDLSIIVYINSNDPSNKTQQYIGGFVSLYKDSSWCNTSHSSTSFAYTGGRQYFNSGQSGYYRLQVWGAQGGYVSNPNNGGKGGYAEGIIHLDKGESISVYVGGSGNTGGLDGGWNGGGAGIGFNGGGGATDIRVEGNTLYHRILVAGGGGSGSRYDEFGAGAGGGVTGINGAGSGGEPGTQTAPGSDGAGFGYGGNAVHSGTCGGSNDGIDGSGGGGWYGGAAGWHDFLCFDGGSGGGGSGFAYDGTNEDLPEGYAVSSHVLTNTLLLSGESSDIPTHDNASTMTGNTGNGYAVITFVSLD